MKILGLPPDIGTPGVPLQEVGQKEPIGPCGQYRIKYPFEALDAREGVFAEYGGYPLSYVWEYVRDFDLVVLHRQTMPSAQTFVDNTQNLLGKKVVVDVDDAVLNLDPRNPAYVWWGADDDLVWEVFCRLRDAGQVSERMKTVRPKEVLKIVRTNREGLLWMLRHADLVTVTTEFLRKEYSRYADNIAVLPNSIKLSDWTDVAPKRHPDAKGKLVIGWSGGDSHLPDLVGIKNAVARVLRKNENVVFFIVGYPGGVELFPEDVRSQILAVPWEDIDQYRGWLGSFDIGVAPAQPNKTNRAKSGIRIYELALARPDGMAVVASPFPYQDDVHKGMGTIAANDQKFEKALLRYINDRELAYKHGVALREHVWKEHSMATNVDKWHNAYRDLVN